MKIDDGLEVIMWIRCLGGERLPTASYALRPNLNNLFFSPRREEISRFFVVCFLPTRPLHTFDLDTEYTHGQRASCRARPVNIDGDLRNFMWIHVRGGERLLVMSYALCPNPPKCLFFAIGDGSRFFVICFLRTSGQLFFSQTPGRRPPYITGLRVNSVTLGWFGAPNERAPLRAHDSTAVFAVRCLTSTPIADQGLGGFMNIALASPAQLIFSVSYPGEFKFALIAVHLPAGMVIYRGRNSNIHELKSTRQSKNTTLEYKSSCDETC